MFEKFKKNKTWKVYKDKIGNNPAIFRVDTSYINKNYVNTLSVNIKYDSIDVEKLPNVEQKSYIDKIENIILNAIKSNNLNIYFVGAASFNSTTYLIFVTNEHIDWKVFIETLIPSPRIEAIIYAEDNMGYYNNVLYPQKH